ncbi:MAG: dihydropteroate synthase [Armatimonadetes bacterium]|nr:dihydropteroate synthase [Armatimonadota bacterium]
MAWRCCERHELPLGQRTLVMGIINVTPDSFSGDGIIDTDAAVAKAWKFVEEGADIVDIGGESTRPGSQPVHAAEEMRRVLPVIERLVVENFPLPISVDTYKPEVAKLALEAGACIVNDIFGLRQPRMMDLVAERKPAVVIMHMQGTPQTMQINPTYEDCVREIAGFLKQQAETVMKLGLPKDKIIVDPGIGFGKTVEHNLEILRRLREIKLLGFPVLVGTSRKSFIGKILGIEVPAERVWGTAATVAIAIANGADIIRVHDVREMVQVVKMTDAIVRG